MGWHPRGWLALGRLKVEERVQLPLMALRPPIEEGTKLPWSVSPGGSVILPQVVGKWAYLGEAILEERAQLL